MKVIKYLSKFIVAAVVAVLILSLIFSAYYLVPLRVENPDNNTDYKWESGAPWIRMEEGISYGRFDANGFNNLEVVENPDVLILGSSQMEAVNVPQNKNTAFYLSQMLDGQLTVYNMGISGHFFDKTCQYLPQTLEVYESVPKYIVIETGGTSISEDDAKSILSHSAEKTPVSKNAILNLMQRSPFFRVMYYQLDGGLINKLSESKDNKSKVVKKTEKKETVSEEIDVKPYDDVFAYLKSLQDQYDTQIIILYHLAEVLNADGTVTFPHGRTFDAFAESAEAHEVILADATAEFEKLYNERFLLPHGFITGKIGEGHLNSHGHYAVAKTLYEAISEDMEADHADN